MMLHTAKSLGVVIIAVALFTACSEALVSQVGGEFDKAAGECEKCEHCESGTELVNKEPKQKKLVRKLLQLTRLRKALQRTPLKKMVWKSLR